MTICITCRCHPVIKWSERPKAAHWHIMYDCTSEIPNSDLQRYEFGPSEDRIRTFGVTNSDLWSYEFGPWDLVETIIDN